MLEIKSLPETIEAPELWLRRHSLEDAAEIFDLINRNREHLRPFMPWERHTQSPADSRAWLEKSRRDWDEGISFDYGLFEKATGLRIGGFGVHHIAWQNQCAELGYWIQASSQGRGFIGQAVRAIESVLFGRGFHRVEIRCSALNEKSQRVARAQGYQLEGRLRENTVENGEFRDTLVFGKLQDEWRVGGISV